MYLQNFFIDLIFCLSYIVYWNLDVSYLCFMPLGGAGVDFMSQHRTGAPIDLPQCLFNSEEEVTLYFTHSSEEQNEMQRLTLK